jgi:hypothetical protein
MKPQDRTTAALPNAQTNTNFQVILPESCMLRFISPGEFRSPSITTLRELRESVHQNYNALRVKLNDGPLMQRIEEKLNGITGAADQIGRDAVKDLSNAFTFIMSLHRIAVGVKGTVHPAEVIRPLVNTMDQSQRPQDWTTLAKATHEVARHNRRNKRYALSVLLLTNLMKTQSVEVFRATLLKMQKELKTKGKISNVRMGVGIRFDRTHQVHQLSPVHLPAEDKLKDIYFDPDQCHWAVIKKNISQQGHLESVSNPAPVSLFITRDGKVNLWDNPRKKYVDVTGAKFRTYAEQLERSEQLPNTDRMPVTENRVDVIRRKPSGGSSYNVLYASNRQTVEALRDYQDGVVIDEHLVR